MRIPRRTHDTLPGHAAWIITENPGLVVYLDDDILADSSLEQAHVRQAQRAWRHRHDRFALLPAPIAGGGGFGWLMRQLRRPTVAAGAAVAAAGVALAVMPIVVPHTPTEQLMPRAAPSGRTTAPPPERSTAPHKAAKPAPKAPAPQRPVSHPIAAVAVSTSHLHVDPARLPVRLPVRIPPVHVRPPKVPVPPVTTPPVTSPVTAMQCRLVRLDLRIARVCL